MLRLPLHLKRALLQIVCALMLLAQHVAIAHAVLHAYKHGFAQQELGVQADRSDRDHTPKLSKLCAFDAVLGQVLGCTFQSADFLATPQVHSEPGFFYRHGVHPNEFLVPLSRGPPSPG